MCSIKIQLPYPIRAQELNANDNMRKVESLYERLNSFAGVACD